MNSLVFEGIVGNDSLDLSVLAQSSTSLVFEGTIGNESLNLNVSQTSVPLDYELTICKFIKGDNAPQVQVQYSADNVNWHTTATSGDKYIRFSVDGGVTWGNSIKVLGSSWGEIFGTLSNQADLQQALNNKANSSDLNAHTSNGNIHVTAENKSTWSAKYDKPSGGIPKIDLSDSVKSSLDKADTALQEHQSLSAYRTASAQDVIDATKQDVIDAENKLPYSYLSGTPNLSAFITKSVNNLTNYYLKTETYTQAEVNQLISAIKQFTYEVVSVLPTASASTMHKIYLVPSASSQQGNVKDEFITIDNGAEAQTRYTWEQIGSTSIDLSNYVTTSQLSTALQNYVTSSTLATTLEAYSTTTQMNTAISNHHDSTKQNVINDSNKLPYAYISGTPTIPVVEEYTAQEVDTLWDSIIV